VAIGKQWYDAFWYFIHSTNMLSRKLSLQNKILSSQVICITLGSLFIGFGMGYSYQLERETPVLWYGFVLALIAVFLPLLSVGKLRK
jgi:hypothetical protein